MSHAATADRSRELARVIPSIAASDGAGVRLRRSIGAQPGLRLDPFLMLDEFFSDDPDDYLAGFPAHPHRGFETVTIMLDGHMRHEDHLGNRGDLGPGDVQWMTAARGIIHSEMPQQENGRMRGFQLWINLPARDKMSPPAWRDVPAREIPGVELDGGGRARVIAGEWTDARGSTAGPIRREATLPQLFDVALPAGVSTRLRLPATHSAFVYVYDGRALIGAARREVPARTAGVLTEGDVLQITAGGEGARLLVLAARPLREPVVQYGPFVMNSREEIEQALDDFRSGRFGAPVESHTAPA